MASSPLPEVDEDVGDALDLWDAASLDYPGRDIDEPHGWEFMDEHISFEEPRYHTWHLWIGETILPYSKPKYLYKKQTYFFLITKI